MTASGSVYERAGLRTTFGVKLIFKEILCFWCCQTFTVEGVRDTAKGGRMITRVG